MAGVTTGELIHRGHRLVYDDYGAGGRPFVLIHGLLLSKQMHSLLAEALAERGNRVICMDLLGHGGSERPVDLARYSMPGFGEEVLALMDHLDLDEAVIGGTSLGANVALEVAVRAGDRARGLVIEMPVLDNALLACAVAFTPLLVALTFGEPAMRLLARAMRLVPRGAAHLGDTALEWLSQDPAPSAAVLQGLFFGRTAPPRTERTKIEAKALVIGHPRDPIHPFSDSDALVRELSNGRLLEANSVLELRLRPQRLTDEIARFLDECWRPAEARPQRKAAGRASA